MNPPYWTRSFRYQPSSLIGLFELLWALPIFDLPRGWPLTGLPLAHKDEIESMILAKINACCTSTDGFLRLYVILGHRYLKTTKGWGSLILSILERLRFM